MNLRSTYKWMTAQLCRTTQGLAADEKGEALEWGTIVDRSLDNSVTTAHFADNAIVGIQIDQQALDNSPQNVV